MIRGVSDPEKPALNPKVKQLYVASEDTNSLVTLDVASGEVIASQRVGGEPEGVRVERQGTLST